MGKLFGSEIFDPKFILTQIWVLQSGFYLIQFFILTLLNAFFGLHNDLGQIFSDQVFLVQDAYGLVWVLTNILSLPFVCAGIVIVVERTYKCLDFTVTLYLIHLAFVVVYSGIPFNLYWWGMNGILVSVTVLISEYFCMKIEQQEITLTFTSTKSI